MATNNEPAWSASADQVAKALKRVGDSDVVQAIMSGLERYSIDVHGSSESPMLPILRELKRAAEDRIRSV